jgi:hypothetical protein
MCHTTWRNADLKCPICSYFCKSIPALDEAAGASSLTNRACAGGKLHRRVTTDSRDRSPNRVRTRAMPENRAIAFL